MVKIIDVKPSVNSEGKEYFSFLVMGGIEPVLSQQSGRYYLTARTSLVATTFDEPIARGFIGSQLPGEVVREDCEPYDFTTSSGEVISLSHRYQYQPEPIQKSVPVEFPQPFLTSVEM